jgi:hypothetical protein
MRRGQSLNRKHQRIADPVRGRCEAYLYGKIRVPNHRAKTPEFTTVYRLKPGLTRRGTQPLASAMTSSKHVYEVRPRKDHRCVKSNFRCVAIRSAVVRRTERHQQRNRLRAIYFAFLVWDSVRARHTSIAETAPRPSQGRRSRNVMTFIDFHFPFFAHTSSA